MKKMEMEFTRTTAKVLSSALLCHQAVNGTSSSAEFLRRMVFPKADEGYQLDFLGGASFSTAIVIVWVDQEKVPRGASARVLYSLLGKTKDESEISVWLIVDGKAVKQ